MKKKRVGIINLNINNIHSIYAACKVAGYKIQVIDDQKNNYNQDVIILPGIGSYKAAMKKIKEMKFNEKIKDFLEKKNKLLVGICLGMQLFFTKSKEFGDTKGLNLIEGSVEKIDKKLIVPHTGWNQIKLKKDNTIFTKRFDKKFYYFTHSFFCKPLKVDQIYGQTEYSKLKFCSVIGKKNIIGMQFHPEKSGKIGLELIKNFQRY